MRRLAIFGMMLLLPVGTAVFAQETARPQVEAQKKRAVPQGSVVGHVTFADVHGPARGAKVMLMSFASVNGGSFDPGEDGHPHMAVTGLDGGFVLPHIAPGDYYLLAFAAGYLSPLDGISMPGNGTDNKAVEKTLSEKASAVHVSGAEAARMDIELQRGGILTGRVVYSDGMPAGQLPVQLENTAEKKTSGNPEENLDMGAVFRTMLMMQSYVTDDQGHFRISGIAPGSYRLAVTQKFESNAGVFDGMSAAFTSLIQEKGLLKVYSGDTLHAKDAKVYELKVGDVVDGMNLRCRSPYGGPSAAA